MNVGDSSSNLGLALGALAADVLAVQRRTYLHVQRPTTVDQCLVPSPDPLCISRGQYLRRPNLNTFTILAAYPSNTQTQLGAVLELAIEDPTRLLASSALHHQFSLSCCTSQRSPPFTALHLWMLEFRCQLVLPTLHLTLSRRVRMLCPLDDRLLRYGYWAVGPPPQPDDPTRFARRDNHHNGPSTSRSSRKLTQHTNPKQMSQADVPADLHMRGPQYAQQHLLFLVLPRCPLQRFVKSKIEYRPVKLVDAGNMNLDLQTGKELDSYVADGYRPVVSSRFILFPLYSSLSSLFVLSSLLC